MDEVDEVLAQQDGVIARFQALESGLSRTAIARAVRRREWVPVHPGVYVHHTGPLSWQQRAWAAVLRCWPAALTGRSALGEHDGPLHVAVDRHRHIAAPAGAVLHRTSALTHRVQWNLSPPRMRCEDAVIDLAAAAKDELAAIAVLADACGARRTTARRLRERLDERPWMPRRGFLAGVLDDVANGTCSVLEHGYLDRVERAHGLPTGRRQHAREARVIEDVEYAELGLVVELDGLAFHASVRQRDQDLARDLAHAVDRSGTTLRLGYGQVFRDGCRTAVQVGAVMQRLGWAGAPVRCEKCGGPDQPG